MYMYINLYIYIYMCVCVCMCACICACVIVTARVVPKYGFSLTLTTFPDMEKIEDSALIQENTSQR